MNNIRWKFGDYIMMLAGVFATIKIEKYISIENTFMDFALAILVLLGSWWILNQREDSKKRTNI